MLQLTESGLLLMKAGVHTSGKRAEQWCDAGAPKASTETLMIQFEEISAQSQALVDEAEQLVRGAQAFEQPEPQFAGLTELRVCCLWQIFTFT